MHPIKLFFLLVSCILGFSVTTAVPSTVYGETPAVTGSAFESAQRGEIELIIDALTDSPQVESVRQNRQHLKRSIAEYRQKIVRIEKEIAQLDLALQGIDQGKISGLENTTEALAELVSIKKQKELELIELRLLSMAAESAIGQLDQYIRDRENSDTFFKSAPLWHLFAEPPPLQTVSRSSTYASSPGNHQAVVLLIVLSALFYVLLSIPKVEELIKAFVFPGNMLHILLLLVTGSSPLLKFISGTVLSAALLVTAAFFMFSNQPAPVIGVLILYFYLVGRLLLQGLTYRLQPGDPAESKGDINGKNASVILNSFSLISAAVFVFSSGYNLYDSGFRTGAAFSSLLFFCWLVSFTVFIRYLCRNRHAVFWTYAKFPLLAAVVLLAALEILGYRNLTDHLTVTAGATFIIFCLALFLYDSIDVFMELFNAVKKRAVARLDLTPVEESRRLKTHRILGFVLKIFVCISAGIIILHEWGVTSTDDERLIDFFFQGIAFGGFIISPARISLAILFFVLSWPAVDYVKQAIDQKWLVAADMTKSARDTFLTISGYVGYAIIILIIFGVAGVKLTGLTVIIGALSVGIGFGLQNVVNNFISGLILMFERPIKKGDWIVVGTTEGYVKKISIRSTIVQTFDRADVIVPNSELIANQVTNMMFEDMRGRLRVSVGVAYGSDTELVQRLLLEVAHAHKQVITDGSTPEPRALFQMFGDSSLNFDLLVHLKDIDLKVRVRSELNMAIDKTFREHGIEIPFPQRDVHLKESLGVSDS